MRRGWTKSYRRVSITLDFLSKHFAVLSGLLILSGISLAMAYMAGYFLQTDINLTVLIDYSDIAKIATVALTGSFVLLLFIVIVLKDTGMFIMYLIKRPLLLSIIGISSVMVFASFVALHIDYSGSVKLQDVVAYLMIAITSLSIPLASLYSVIKRHKPFTTKEMFIIPIFTAFAFGNLIGFMNRNNDQKYSIFMKSKDGKQEVYRGVSLILLLSHHIAYAIDGKISIIQTPDVDRISED